MEVLRQGVIVICRGPLESYPPVITVIGRLLDYVPKVVVIVSSCDAGLLATLSSRGAIISCVGEEQTAPMRQWRTKIKAAIAFRRVAWQKVAEHGDCMLWIGCADAAIVLGPRLRKHRYVLQVHELYDKEFRYRILLGRLLRSATCVVVPEASRAAIMRVWYHLPETPRVIPNMPFLDNRAKHAHISDDRARLALAEVKDSRMVLYQGHVCRERDIRVVAATVHGMGSEWRFVIMGDDQGFLSAIREVCPSLVYIPYIPAPQHLEITSHAYIGLAGYDFSSLNNVFCAPNKIWEYAAFSIPMLCNDVPGLRFTVGTSGAGICCDFRDSSRIKSALSSIDSAYGEFSSRACQFYEGLDPSATLRQIYEQCTHT